MKHILFTSLLIAFGAFTQTALGQRWEIGGGVGGSFFTSQTVKNGLTSGDAGLANGIVGSFWFGNNSSHLLGGELRYDYQRSDLKLSSGGTSTTFGADTHAVHYDFLLHLAPRDSRVRPYVSGGGGIKVFRGTGKETTFQPISNLALLTKTTETKGLLSIGTGVKFSITPVLQLRVEVRDEVTPFPKQVIAAAQGAKLSGWLQDFIASVGVSATF
jgi:hypothetical protein